MTAVEKIAITIGFAVCAGGAFVAAMSNSLSVIVAGGIVSALGAYLVVIVATAATR